MTDPFKLFAKVPHDKAMHCIGGTLIFIAGNLTISPEAGLLLCAIAAVGKEVLDSTGYGNVDWKDALATIVGGVMGWLCTIGSPLATWLQL